MNRKNEFKQVGNQFRRTPSYEQRPARREPRWSDDNDDSSTGQESKYLGWLVETGHSLVIVLRQGEEIVGKLAWNDLTCLNIKPRDGSPSLLIPKSNIKYLYEEVLTQFDARGDHHREEATVGGDFSE